MAFIKLGDWGSKLFSPPGIQARNIQGGSITAKTIQLAGGNEASIRSSTYDEDNRGGWAIFGDGAARFGGVRVASDDPDTMSFYTGDASEDSPGLVNVSNGGPGVAMVLTGPTDTTDPAAINTIHLESWDEDNDYGLSLQSVKQGINFQVDEAKSFNFRPRQTSTAWLNLDSSDATFTVVLLAPDGDATDPAYAFADTTNTGFYKVAASRIGVSLSGTQRFEFHPKGLMTDQSNNTLPRVFFTNSEDRTNTSGSTWESLTTTIDVDLGTETISATIIGSAFFEQTASTTRRDGRFRVQWSSDGGSTWNDGAAFRADGMASNRTSRMPVTCQAKLDNVTLTGNFQVRMQFFTTHTEMTLVNAIAQAIVVGDI